MTILKEQRIALVVIFCSFAAVMANAYPGKISSELEAVNGSQDVRSLDRRISLLEQRLYSIERNISRLEQTATSPRRPEPPASAPGPEINLIRGELQSFQLRLSEIECGLVKLDERTTTSAAREARRNSGATAADPCRIGPASPLGLSTRP